MIDENTWKLIAPGWRNLRNSSLEIMEFLKQGYPNAFKQTEIIEGIKYGGKSKNISSILVRLKNKELIECKKPYWRYRGDASCVGKEQ